jgi:hypothetical protein
MKLPSSMHYVLAREPGPPEVLAVAETQVPAPKQGEVLIRVAYAGVNRPDCVQRAGGYPPPPDASPIIGLEVSGTIAALVASLGLPEADAAPLLTEEVVSVERRDLDDAVGDLRVRPAHREQGHPLGSASPGVLGDSHQPLVAGRREGPAEGNPAQIRPFEQGCPSLTKCRRGHVAHRTIGYG